MGEIGLRVGGKHQRLVPVGQPLLTIECRDDPFFLQTDDPEFPSPGDKQRLAEHFPGALINDLFDFPPHGGTMATRIKDFQENTAT